jgi:hypothetical protein
MTAKTATAAEKFEALAAEFVEEKLDDHSRTAYLGAAKATDETAREQDWTEGDDKYSAAFLEEYAARLQSEDSKTASERVGEALDAAIAVVKDEIKKADTKDEKPKVCAEEGCDREDIYSRGYCRKHYEIHRTTDPDRPDCSHPGCDQKVYTKGLCRKHYVAQRSTAAHAGLNVEDRAVLVEVVEALAKMRKGGGPLIAQAREILGMAPQTEALPVVKKAE